VALVLIVIGAAVGGSHSSNVVGITTATTTPPIIAADSPNAPAPPAPNNPSEDAWGDVTLLDCSTKTEQFMTTATANVRITNHTDSAQSYMVDVGLNNAAGKRVAEATAVSNSLPAGHSVTVTGHGYPDGPISGMHCELANVSRLPG
jgi:hypothetical protein